MYGISSTSRIHLDGCLPVGEQDETEEETEASVNACLLAHSDDSTRYRAEETRPHFMSISGWIGVDLDGTLAHYTGWKGPDDIGDPIPEMAERVREWCEQGITVKIFTARACIAEQIQPVRDWLARHGFPDLEVTNVKDFQMIELWDDRCVRVVSNTGQPCCPDRLLVRSL